MTADQDSTRAQKSSAPAFAWTDMTSQWEKLVAQAAAQSNENLDTWVSSLNAFADTQKTLFKRTAAYSEKTLINQWEAAKALGSAKTPAEAARIHAAMAPQTIDSCVREATELFQLASEGMTAALQPFRARTSSLMKSRPRV